MKLGQDLVMNQKKIMKIDGHMTDREVTKDHILIIGDHMMTKKEGHSKVAEGQIDLEIMMKTGTGRILMKMIDQGVVKEENRDLEIS